MRNFLNILSWIKVCKWGVNNSGGRPWDQTKHSVLWASSVSRSSLLAISTLERSDWLWHLLTNTFVRFFQWFLNGFSMVSMMVVRHQIYIFRSILPVIQILLQRLHLKPESAIRRLMMLQSNNLSSYCHLLTCFSCSFFSLSLLVCCLCAWLFRSSINLDWEIFRSAGNLANNLSPLCVVGILFSYNPFFFCFRFQGLVSLNVPCGLHRCLNYHNIKTTS